MFEHCKRYQKNFLWSNVHVIVFLGVPLSRKEQWDVLCKHLTALKGSMNTSALMSYLAQRNLLTLNESEILTNPLHTSEEKANKVLLWIPQKGPHALRKFIECLRDSAGDQGAGHHSDLADYLQDSLCKFVDDHEKKKCKLSCSIASAQIAFNCKYSLNYCS